MKVILIEDVEKLGVQGQIVDVKPGFARNYLIPKGLAWLYNNSNLKKLEHQKKLWEVKNIKEKEKAQSLKEKIESMEIKIPAKVGEENLLYGSITTSQIAKALEDKGILIDKRKIMMDEPIKRAGYHDIKLKLHRDVEATLKIEVVSEEP
jgi:large subunit ribosomal protein L9